MMVRKDPTYTDEQIAEQLRALPGWYYEDKWIRRQFKTDGWPTTLMLVNAIAYLAEAAFHHPDLTVTWAKVGVKLRTSSSRAGSRTWCSGVPRPGAPRGSRERRTSSFGAAIRSK